MTLKFLNLKISFNINDLFAMIWGYAVGSRHKPDHLLLALTAEFGLRRFTQSLGSNTQPLDWETDILPLSPRLKHLLPKCNPNKVIFKLLTHKEYLIRPVVVRVLMIGFWLTLYCRIHKKMYRKNNPVRTKILIVVLSS